MSRYGKEKQKEHMELVRQALVVKPGASIYVIEEMLKKADRPLHLHYILKIRNKIEAERRVRFDRRKVQARLAEMQDKMEQVQEKMWKILLDPRSDDNAKVRAGVAIMDMERKFFDHQMDAGIFERKLGEFEVRHNLTIDEETKRKIIAAMQNYGIIKVEAKTVEVKQIYDVPTSRGATDQ